MDLNLTAAEKQFRDELRAWLEANVPKDWNEWREKPLEESFSYLRAWQRKLYEGGWAAVSWPKEYGGRSAISDGAIDLLGRDGARGSATHGEFAGARADRPDDHRLRYGGAEDTLHSEDPERRRNLVPGIFGAERGLRSCERCRRKRGSTAITTSSTGRSVDELRVDRAIGASWWCEPIPPCAEAQGPDGAA